MSYNNHQFRDKILAEYLMPNGKPTKYTPGVIFFGGIDINIQEKKIEAIGYGEGQSFLILDISHLAHNKYRLMLKDTYLAERYPDKNTVIELIIKQVDQYTMQFIVDDSHVDRAYFMLTEGLYYHVQMVEGEENTIKPIQRIPDVMTNKMVGEDIPLPDLTYLFNSSPKEPYDFDLAFLKRLDGSTATLPMTVNIIRYFDNVLNVDEAQKHMNYTVFHPLQKLYFIKKQIENKIDMGESEYIQHSGTSHAYERLINGDVPLIFAVAPGKRELKLAQKKNIVLEMIPLVDEAFVFMVSKSNNISSLTLENIQGIYQGKITNWEELGGCNLPIVAYQRNEDSGSQTAMLRMVMKKIPIMKPPASWVQAFMGGLIRHAFPYEGGQGSIGYSYLFYIKNMSTDKNFKILSINDIAPTRENLVNKTYPLSTQYYAVYAKNKVNNTQLESFVKWIKSETARRLLQEVGYWPVK